MRYLLLIICLLRFTSLEANEYDISSSIRFVLSREENPLTPIVYYFSIPEKNCNSYPILLLCEGSTSEGDLDSVLFMRNYFADKVQSLPVGYLTVEKWGIDGNLVNETEFWHHYTRSQRLKDHLRVIQYFQDHPPQGWNGQFIFVGVSEGGALVTDLSMLCSNTLATINWVGAGDWPWREQLWSFLQKLISENPMCPHQIRLENCEICLEYMSSRDSFNALMDTIIADPSANRTFLGMTYLYHADACTRLPIDYTKIQKPFLVVKGTEDSDILSCDQFVNKARAVGAPITYFRIEGMDHWLRKRPDVINQSFDWLKEQLTYNVASQKEKI